MHHFNCYITLTYKTNTEHSLNYDHFQRFMKRLRKAAWQEAMDSYASGSRTQHHEDADMGLRPIPPGIRFYAAGEYGELHGRPHWHALIFGLDFLDKQPLKQTLSGCTIYTSRLLQKLWPYGFSSVGDLTFESAAYVARYVMKKYTGNGNSTHYEIIDPETGEIYLRRKEFNTMSRRSGIGKSWMEKYADDVYSNKGKVILRGHEHNPPRYYDKLYKRIDQAQLEHLKHVRYLEALAHTEHHTPERLAVQEQVSLARTKQLKRNLTSGD